MNRRGFLAALGTLGIGGYVVAERGGVGLPDLPDVEVSVGNASLTGGDGDPNHHDFGMFTGAIEWAEWREGGTLAVQIAEGHDYDRLGFRYAEKADPTEDALQVNVPKYGGEVTMPALQALADEGQAPVGDYSIFGYVSDFSEPGLYEEANTATISIRPTLELRDVGIGEDSVTLDVANTGDAPFLIRSVTTPAGEMPVSLSVGIGQTTRASFDVQVYERDGNCTIKPAEFGVGVRTAPRQVASATIQTDRETDSRECVRRL